MFGKKSEDDVLKQEASAQATLAATRQKLSEVASEIARLEAEYREFARSEFDERAESTRAAINRLTIRRDGLQEREKVELAAVQAVEPLAREERERRRQRALQARVSLLERNGWEAVSDCKLAFEELMRCLSLLEDVREQLAAPDLTEMRTGNLIASLGNAISQYGPTSLIGELLSRGWQHRAILNKVILPEVYSLRAPARRDS